MRKLIANRNFDSSYGNVVALELSRKEYRDSYENELSNMDQLLKVLDKAKSPEKERLFIEYCLGLDQNILLKAA